MEPPVDRWPAPVEPGPPMPPALPAAPGPEGHSAEHAAASVDEAPWPAWVGSMDLPGMDGDGLPD